MKPNPEIVHLEIEGLDFASTGRRYRVLHNGAVLLERCRDPLHEAARALLALGIVGKAATYAVGGTVPRMTFDIEAAATRTTVDGETRGPVTAKWTPPRQDAAEATGAARVAVNEEWELPQWPPTKSPALERHAAALAEETIQDLF